MNTMKITYPQNTTVQQKLFYTIDRLSRMKCSTVFIECMNSKLYPDYHTIITQRVSFQNLKNKISSGKYKYIYEIYEDLRTIAKNHFVYFKGKQTQEIMLKNIAKFIKAIDAVWEALKQQLQKCKVDYNIKLVHDEHLQKKINDMEDHIKSLILKKKLERMGIKPIQEKQYIQENKNSSKQQVNEEQKPKSRQQLIQMELPTPTKFSYPIIKKQTQRSYRVKNKSKSEIIPQKYKINSQQNPINLQSHQISHNKSRKSINNNIRTRNKKPNIYNSQKISLKNTINQKKSKQKKRYRNDSQEGQNVRQKSRRSRRKTFKIHQNIKIYSINQQPSIEHTMILTTMKKFSHKLSRHEEKIQHFTQQNKEEQIKDEILKSDLQQNQQQIRQITKNNIFYECEQSRYNNKANCQSQQQNQWKQPQQSSNTKTISLNIKIKREENDVKIQENSKVNQKQANNYYSDNNDNDEFIDSQNNKINYQNFKENNQNDQIDSINGKVEKQRQLSNQKSIQNQEIQNNAIKQRRTHKRKRGRPKKTHTRKVKTENKIKIQAKNQQQQYHEQQNKDKQQQQQQQQKQQQNQQNVDKVIKNTENDNEDQVLILNPSQIQIQLKNLVRYKLKKYQILLKNQLQWLHLNIIQKILNPPILKCDIHTALDDGEENDQESKKLCYDCVQYEKQLKLFQSAKAMRIPKYLSQNVLDQIQNIKKGQINLKLLLKLLKQFNLWVKLVSGSYLQWRIKEQYIKIEFNTIRCLQKIIQYKKLGPDFKEIINKRKQQNNKQNQTKPKSHINTRSKKQLNNLNISCMDGQLTNMIQNCKKDKQEYVRQLNIRNKYSIVDNVAKQNGISSQISQQYQQFIRMLEDDQLYNDFKVVIVRDFDNPNKLKVMNKNVQNQRKRRRLGVGRFRRRPCKDIQSDSEGRQDQDKQNDQDFQQPRKHIRKSSQQKIRKSKLAIQYEQEQQRQRRQAQQWEKDDQFLYSYSLRSNALIIQKYQQRLQINWDAIFEKKLGPVPSCIEFDDQTTDVARNHLKEGIYKYL